LHQQFSDHPDAWVPPHKELHFFDSDSQYFSPSTFATQSALKRLASFRPWRKDDSLKLRRAVGATLRGDFEAAAWWARVLTGSYSDEFYPSLFPQDGYAAVGEITPSYCILSPEDIQRIHAVNADMKLIFMIRNPIERIWSSLRYNIGRGRLTVQDDDVSAILQYLKETRELTAVARGDYKTAIENFSSVFPSSNLLVVFYDAIREDPAGVLRDVGQFLDIDPKGFKDATVRVNAAKVGSDIPEEVYAVLYEREEALISAMADQFGSYATQWGRATTGAKLYPTIRADGQIP
jgi:hypothetical protein